MNDHNDTTATHETDMSDDNIIPINRGALPPKRSMDFMSEPQNAAVGLHAIYFLDSVLNAFRNGVFRIDPEIVEPQRGEVARELGVMSRSLDEWFKNTGVERVEGTMHFLPEVAYGEDDEA